MNIQPLYKPTGLTAAADLSAASNQYRAVKVTAGFAVNLATVAGEKVDGILLNKPASGQAAEVMSIGLCPAHAGAAIAAGALVMAGADGRIITAATTGSTIIGRCLEAASAAGQIVTIDLLCHRGVV